MQVMHARHISDVHATKSGSSLVGYIYDEALKKITEGLSSPEEMAALRKIFSVLKEEGAHIVHGENVEFRAHFVTAQKIIEQVIAEGLNSKQIKLAEGFIHTPEPSTPLCTKGEISSGLMHPELEGNEACAATIKERSVSLREFLYCGGELYVIYPEEGYYKRNEGQRDIFNTTAEDYAAHLKIRPLKGCPEFDIKAIGATYSITDQYNDRVIFAIQMTQANSNPKENSKYGLWLSPPSQQSVSERVTEVRGYLSQFKSEKGEIPFP